MKLKSPKERGQALIIIALAAIGLFGIAALAIDGSIKFSDRRHAQNAADAAALAASLANINGDSLWKTVAADRALENGYDDNHVTNEVEVYTCNETGASCGPYSGSDNYVQVIIASTVNTYFARILGINETHNTVQAVASIRKGGPLFDGASIVSLNPSPNCGNGSTKVGGNGTINLNGGGIFVNSSASCGYSQTSCSVTLNVAGGAGITSAGSPINVGCASTPVVLQDTTGESVDIPDEVYMPDRPSECSQTALAPNLLGVDSNGVQNWLIHPGYYTDFPQAGLVPNNKNIILESGVYCVNSDIHWSGSSFKSLDGSSGVTIYITAGHTFNTSINSPIVLNASNSGDYAGYLIIIDGDEGSIEDCTINGGSYLDVNGTIFAPYCNITINGDNSTDSEFNAQVIGWDIKLNGNSTINFTYDPSDNAELKRRIGLMK